MDRARWIKAVALVLGVALLGFVAWRWAGWRAAARAGAAYAAHVTCSCRYIEGRGAANCADDLDEQAWFVSLKDVPEKKAVGAHVPLLGQATARYRPGYGCLIDPN